MAVRRDVREPLSRERVLRVAMELADRDGIEGLTMRRLAQELGVEAMSLYHHVANKDDILAGLADLVVDEFALPEADTEWKPAMRAMAISAHEVLQAHRWAAALLLGGATVSPSRLRHMNAMLGTFRRGGFSPELTDHAYHALESHIMGFTLWLVGMSLGTREELAAKATAFLAELPRDLPYLIEHVDQHLRPRPADDPGEFEFGLDLLLDGLERMLDSAPRSQS